MAMSFLSDSSVLPMLTFLISSTSDFTRGLMISISMPQLFVVDKHLVSSLMENMNTHYPNVSMGNTEGLLSNIVNGNIKEICLYLEYKSSRQCQMVIKQVLNLVS